MKVIVYSFDYANDIDCEITVFNAAHFVFFKNETESFDMNLECRVRLHVNVR
jgi:hypothetical protein